MSTEKERRIASVKKIYPSFKDKVDFVKGEFNRSEHVKTSSYFVFDEDNPEEAEIIIIEFTGEVLETVQQAWGNRFYFKGKVWRQELYLTKVLGRGFRYAPKGKSFVSNASTFWNKDKGITDFKFDKIDAVFDGFFIYSTYCSIGD